MARGPSALWSLCVFAAVGAACLPTPRSGGEDPSQPDTLPSPTADLDGGGGEALSWEDLEPPVEPLRACVLPDADLSIDERDGGVPTSGAVIGRAELPGKGALTVERTAEGRLGLRLLSKGTTVSIEPLLRLSGPSTVSIYLGPGCRSVEGSRSQLLATLTGRRRLCALAPTPVAELTTSPPSSCPHGQLEPGTYELSVFPCGSHGEPAKASFDLDSIDPPPSE